MIDPTLLPVRLSPPSAKTPATAEAHAASSARVPLSMQQWYERVRWTQKVPAAGDTLERVRLESQVVEEFRPLAESLEWRLAQLYWQRAGVLPFAESEIPFLVNNSGRLSESAARLLLANCLELSPADGPIVLLEVGAGTGLFARFFLDAFRSLCAQAGRDYYDRLRYVVTDRSPAAIAHWEERKLFAEHQGHVRWQVLDAAEPHLPVAEPLTAVFFNYVLDVLPAAVVRRGPDGEAQQLCVRTYLADGGAGNKQRPALSPPQIEAMVARGDEASLQALLPLLNDLDYEVAFRPNGADALPGIAEALEQAEVGARVLLNHGALACLARSAAALVPHGFLLINDYGPAAAADVPAFGALQRFGRTTAFGVSFPLLEQELVRGGFLVHKADGDDARALHTRLVTKAELPATLDAFRGCFSAAAHHEVEGPVEDARRHAAAGRTNEALASYRFALGRSRLDWALVGEVAEIVNNQVRDHQAALDLARAAVELNPHYSPWLWNVLGDALYCLGRYGEAHEAYLQAERIDPRDGRTNLNLAYTHLQAGDLGAALDVIRRGLEADARGLYRDRLLDKQRQVLAALSERWAAEQDRLLRRHQRFA
jgi:tetratricopeptide (TPR) repeat protein